MLDTNVLIAALNFDGLCRLLLKRATRHDEIFISKFILDELSEKLVENFGWSKEKAHEAVALFREQFTLTDPKPLAAPVCRDPDDDQIIALALHSGADAVVTGDQDLLSLGSHQGLRFVSPREFWDFSAEG